MRSGRRAVMVALLSASVSAAAIVAVSSLDSSAGTDAAAAPRPPEALLPAVWHDSPRAAAALSWTDAAGAPAALADFKGRPVLLNLWATWCAPCLREMPMLDSLAGALGGALSVIALNQDRDAAAAREFWAERGFAHLELFLDPGLAAFKALGVRGLPLTLLIDAEGREVARLEGVAEWTAPEVESYLRALAAE